MKWICQKKGHIKCVNVLVGNIVLINQIEHVKKKYQLNNSTK